MTVRNPESGGARGPSGCAKVARTRRGSVAGLSGATFLPMLLGAVTGPLAARALAPSGRGQVAAVAAFALFLPVVLSLGVPTAIAQRAATEPGMRARLVGAGLRFALLTAVPALLACSAIMTGPLHSIRGPARVLAAVTLAMTPLWVLGLTLQQLLVAEGALGACARIRGLPLMANAVVTVALFLSGRLTVATYLLTSLAANTAGLVATLWFVGDRPSGGYPLRPLMGFGLRGFAGTLASLTNARLDQLIMVPFLGSAQLGIYAVSVSIASIPQGIGQAITARSFGEIASSADQPAEAARYLRLTALVVGAACLAVGLAAPFAIPLVYGVAFRGAVAPLLMLLPGTVALAVVLTASNTLTVLGRPGLPSWAELGGVAVTLGGLAILLRPLGIAGAALASTLSYGTVLGADRGFLRGAGVRGLVPRRDDLRWLLGRIARTGRSVRPT